MRKYFIFQHYRHRPDWTTVDPHPELVTNEYSNGYIELCANVVARMLKVRPSKHELTITVHTRPRNKDDKVLCELRSTTEDYIWMSNPKNASGWSRIILLPDAKRMLEIMLDFKTSEAKRGTRKPFWITWESRDLS